MDAASPGSTARNMAAQQLPINGNNVNFHIGSSSGVTFPRDFILANL